MSRQTGSREKTNTFLGVCVPPRPRSPMPNSVIFSRIRQIGVCSTAPGRPAGLSLAWCRSRVTLSFPQRSGVRSQSIGTREGEGSTWGLALPSHF